MVGGAYPFPVNHPLPLLRFEVPAGHGLPLGCRVRLRHRAGGLGFSIAPGGNASRLRRTDSIASSAKGARTEPSTDDGSTLAGGYPGDTIAILRRAEDRSVRAPKHVPRLGLGMHHR